MNTFIEMDYEDPDNLIRDKFDDLQKCPQCDTIEVITQLQETQ